MADDLRNFVPDRPTNDLSGFVPDAPARSWLGEIGTGLKRFAPAAAQATAATSAGAQEAAGKPVDALTQAALDKSKSALDANQLAPQNHNWVVNALAKAPEAIGSFAPMAAAQFAGEAGGAAAGSVVPGPGTLVGGVAGGASAVGAQQYAQAYHESLAEAKDAGKSDADAAAYAEANAKSSGALGAAFGAIPLVGPGLKMGAKALGIGAAKTATEVGADMTAKKFIPELAKHAAEGQAGLTAYSAASGVAENQNRKEANLPSVSPWEAAAEGAKSSLEGGVAFAPFWALKARTDTRTALKLQDALQKPDNPFRMGAVKQVYDAMDKEDSPGAQMWLINAKEALKQGKPIGLDDSWTKGGGHDSVFPKPSQEMPGATMEGEGGAQQQGAPVPPVPGDPNAPAAMEGEGGGQPQGMASPNGLGEPQLPAAGDVAIPGAQGGFGPFEQSTAADQANAQLHAARDAHEAALQKLASNGPISAAAAEGIRGGLTDAKTAERSEPEPQGKSAPTEEAHPNVEAFLDGVPPDSLSEAQAQAASLSATRPYSVVPHPSGEGYGVIPSSLVNDITDQHAGLQSSDPNAPESNPMAFGSKAAADKAASDLTSKYGREYESVPHPLSSERFSVQPKADVQKTDALAEREQPQEPNSPVVADLSAEGLKDLKIRMPVYVEETGETLHLEQDAKQALVEGRSKLRRLEQLMKCIQS